MSELIDKVTRLIQRAKETGDMELLELATDLLNSDTHNNKQVPVEKPKAKFEEFTMSNRNENTSGSRPLDVRKRVNKFVDDGSLHEDVETPSIKINERRRNPFKKISQSCSLCNKVVEVHPQFVREFFKCDKCMRR
jgi:hypothetical protein